jgi:hypothetical protein
MNRNSAISLEPGQCEQKLSLDAPDACERSHFNDVNFRMSFDVLRLLH